MRVVAVLALLCLPLAACGRGGEQRAQSSSTGGAPSAASRTAPAGAAEATPTGAGRTIEVRMVEQSPTAMRFEPAEITVHRGDVVRFVDAGVQPHNVAFVRVPPGAELGSAMTGPYVTQKGQTYELRIDEHFPPGRYEFVCQPHQAFGMKGTLVVQS